MRVITQEDLLEEVAAKLRPAWPEGGFTIGDMAKKMGWPKRTTARKLQKLVDAGELAFIETVVNRAPGKVFYKPKVARDR